MANIETNTIKPELSFLENDIENVILTKQHEFDLDKQISDIENYIKNNTGKGKSEEEKDSLYEVAQEMWKKLKNILTDCKYNFYLNRAQYKFLTDLLLGRLEYDVNTVFFAIELTDLLGTMKDVKYLNDKDLIAFPVNATEITYIYHLISTYKVKGLTRDAYTFSQILRRIGGISKVFNYYDTSLKNLGEDIKLWVATFEEGVTSEELNKKYNESV
jgi:hypothetical protein